MTKQVQIRRGTDSQHTSFTGAEGEISVNTTNDSVHVHDGTTAGGKEMARADGSNVAFTSGTIDGTVIGGTTPAAGTFTTGDFNTSLNVDGTITSDGLTVDGDVLITTNTNTNPVLITRLGNIDQSLQISVDDDSVIFKSEQDETGRFGGYKFISRNAGTDIERLVIDLDGNLGIGTTPDSNALLHLKKTSAVDTILRVENTNAGGYGSVLNLKSTGNFSFSQFEGGTKTWLVGQRGLSGGSFSIYDVDNTAHRMVIDSSGNLLVGKTTPSISTTGSELRSDGYVIATFDGDAPLYLNRLTSDGDIAKFYKDGSTVGSIQSSGGTNLHVQGTAAVVFTTGSTNRAYVASTGILAWLDDTYDLGSLSGRWDDVYATNGTIQTSDANEKQQIASLTDAEITAAKAISKLFKTFKWNNSVEEKGDAARTHTGVIAQDVQQAMTDAGLDAGDYAFFISATWWETQTEVPAVEAVEAQDAVYDDDGNLVSEAVEAVEAQDAYTRTDTYDTADEAPEGATERTRMGIRYPELLAFIGAATEQRLADIETRLTALETL